MGSASAGVKLAGCLASPDFDPARQGSRSQGLIEWPRIGRFAVRKHGPESRLQWRHACGQPGANEPCKYIPCSRRGQAPIAGGIDVRNVVGVGNDRAGPLEDHRALEFFC